MKEVLSILFSTRGGKAHRLPRLFENRRDEGRTGSGARQLPSSCRRPEQTRRKRVDGRRENGYRIGKRNRMNRWKSVARCAEGILANVAVIGIGLAVYEQKLWPALVIGAGTAAAALFIAWSVNHD